MGMRPERSAASRAGSRSARTTVVAEVRQRGRRGQPDVAGADHGHRVARCGRRGRWCARSCRPPPVAAARGRRPSRARPSCQSGRAGQAAAGAAPCCRAPSRPGRAPGSGGSRSAVRMGRTRSGSAPASARTARTKPHHVVAPPLVTWKMPGPAVEPERDDGRRQVGGERRRPVLVVDEAQLARRPRPGAARSPTMLAPWAPHTQLVRTMVEPGRHSRSPASFDAP